MASKKKQRIKQLATMTLIEHEDGNIQCIVTSHPDGNPLEQFLTALMALSNEASKWLRQNGFEVGGEVSEVEK